MLRPINTLRALHHRPKVVSSLRRSVASMRQNPGLLVRCIGVISVRHNELQLCNLNAQLLLRGRGRRRRGLAPLIASSCLRATRPPRMLSAAMSASNRPSRPPVVLIASDQEWAARSLETVLGPRGYAVLRAGTGQRALELARIARPDAYIIDAGMSDI